MSLVSQLQYALASGYISLGLEEPESKRQNITKHSSPAALKALVRRSQHLSLQEESGAPEAHGILGNSIATCSGYSQVRRSKYQQSTQCSPSHKVRHMQVTSPGHAKQSCMRVYQWLLEMLSLASRHYHSSLINPCSPWLCPAEI